MYGSLIPTRRHSGFGSNSPALGFFDRFDPNMFTDLFRSAANTGVKSSIDNGKISYEVNLAGFDEDDIKLKADPKTNMLYVSAESKSDSASSQVSYALDLGDGKITPESIQSTYKNGLLTLTVSSPELEQGEAFDVAIGSNSNLNGADQLTIDDSTSDS